MPCRKRAARFRFTDSPQPRLPGYPLRVDGGLLDGEEVVVPKPVVVEGPVAAIQVVINELMEN